MERSYNRKNYLPPKNNNWVPKKAPQDRRPPNQLESTNMVEEVLPYCRPCEALHEEATCYVACKILEKGLLETTNKAANVQETLST